MRLTNVNVTPKPTKEVAKMGTAVCTEYWAVQP